MDPQQEIFTAVLTGLRDSPYGDAVFDGALPPKATPYPFIYVGDSQLVDDINKQAVLGRVYQHIDVYSNKPHKRGETSAILFAIKNLCRQITKTQNFGWDLIGVDEHIVPDNTTDEPLLHGYLDLTFRFS